MNPITSKPDTAVSANAIGKARARNIITMTLIRNYAKSAGRLPAFTLTELMTVLAIVGILMLVAMPVFDSLFGDAYSIEAKNQLAYLHSRQQAHYQQYFSYAEDFRSIGFSQPESIEQNGTSRYAYEIVSAGKQDFLARATAVADFDGDGTINVWEIDSGGRPTEVTPD